MYNTEGSIIEGAKTKEYALLTSSFRSSYLFGDIVKEKTNETVGFIAFCIAFCLRGFLSMPLVIHISTFDFTIALDSLIWGGVDFLSNWKDNTEKNVKESKKENIELNVKESKKENNELNEKFYQDTLKFYQLYS